jgi:hypothetical protein
MEDRTVKALFASGLLYELAGFAYYIYFLLMSRGANAARFSRRSRILILVAAIVLVASVPLHYATNTIGSIVALLVATCALISAYLDTRHA